MTSRWMQVKKRQRRAYLKKQPAGKFNSFLMRDLYGAGRHEHSETGPDWLDDIEPDYKKQRVWIDQQRRNQRREQINKPRPGVPQDIWYKTVVQDISGLLVELWFSGTKYKIVEINELGGKTSAIYHDRQELLSAYRRGDIIWDIIITNPGE